MKIIDLEQGSAEWHLFRQNHIGGSDAPIIMGVSPYKTKWELWAEKVGLRSGQPKTESMARGNMLEPKARDIINKENSWGCVPMVFEHDKIPWLSYSSDGYDPDYNILIEIKCGTKQEHEDVKKGKMPYKYYPQLQHALLVTGNKWILYVSYHDGEVVDCQVQRDQLYIDIMLKELNEFWRCVEMLEEPVINEFHKKHSKPQYITRSDDIWNGYAMRWTIVQKKKKEILDEESSLRHLILEHSNYINSEGAGIKLLRVEQKGTVDYSLIPQLENIDLDLYRKPEKSFWRIDLT